MPAGGTPEYFDPVIVGSGFGGSVSAARLAAQDTFPAIVQKLERRP